MDKLFALHHIDIQELVDQEGRDIFIAYNDDLLEKNVLIEFYEEDQGDNRETAVFVFSCDNERSYRFTLYVVDDVLTPLVIFPIVANAIDFIKHCNKETLFDDLPEISTHHVTSEQFDDKRNSQLIFELDAWKFNTAMELIAENRRATGK